MLISSVVTKAPSGGGGAHFPDFTVFYYENRPIRQENVPYLGLHLGVQKAPEGAN